MPVLTEQDLISTFENKVLPPLQKQIAEKLSEVERGTNEKLAKELEVLQGYQKEYTEAIAELKKVNDRKMATGEGDAPPPEHKFKGFDHFLEAIVKAGPSGRDESDILHEWRKHSEEKVAGSPSMNIGEAEQGGYLIPTDYAEQLLERLPERSIIYGQAMVIPMATKTLNIPFLNAFDESQGKTSGGIKWYWTGEEVAYTATNPEVGVVGLDLSKLTGMAYLTDEILKWSRPSVLPLVERAFELGMVRAINRACIRGTGTNQPMGVLNATCAHSVAKETNQAAATFVIENAASMFASLYQPDENAVTASWWMNRNVIPQLVVMSVTAGLGGSGVFLVNGSVQNRLNMSLLGYPISFSSLCSTLGTEGDVILSDWSQYLIGQPAGAAGAEMVQSIHIKFDYGQMAFRFTMWLDGKPWWKSEFIPEYGDKQAPFVKLATRS